MSGYPPQVTHGNLLRDALSPCFIAEADAQFEKSYSVDFLRALTDPGKQQRLPSAGGSR